MTDTARHIIPESSKPPVENATRGNAVPSDETVELTLTLRGPALPSADEIGERAVDPDRFAADYGARQSDVDAVTQSMERRGLTVLDASNATWSVRVEGPARAVQDAFGVELAMYRVSGRDDEPSTEYRGQEGHVTVPSELQGIVTGVFGLDLRQVAHRRSVTTHTAATRAQTPQDLEDRYQFPTNSAAGQKVAIAEFGGAYFPDDLRAYCEKFDRPDATATTDAISVGFPILTVADIKKLPADQRKWILDATTEVMMDIEIVAGLAPGAEIAVYFAPFTQKGWVDLLNRVILDRPVALSVSWGSREDDPRVFSGAAVKAIGERLAAAAALGITVCVASGDDGSGDGGGDDRCHVDFPAASPFVLSVGGTELEASGNEVTWFDAPGDRSEGGGATGGGVSTVIPRPAWQDVTVRRPDGGPEFDGRVVPDVAALSGRPGYDLIVMGQDSPSGGTSASTPLWAALIARTAAGKGAGFTPRFLTPLLYQAGNGATVCRDIDTGQNASSPSPGVGYEAGSGYDAVTGWGVPIGTQLSSVLP